jgi:hypothetical protein
MITSVSTQPGRLRRMASMKHQPAQPGPVSGADPRMGDAAAEAGEEAPGIEELWFTEERTDVTEWLCSTVGRSARWRPTI